MNIVLWQKIDRYITDGNFEDAMKELSTGLDSQKSERFKNLVKLDFTNDPVQVAFEINEFIYFCEENFEVKSVYLEMNGFDVNPDRWYFDFFGYDTYDEEGIDWLCDWISGDWPDVTLWGLEETQNDFDWYSNQSGYKDDSVKESKEYALLFVMLKFANLIRKAAATGKIKKGIHVLATAHDFDIVARFLT